MKIPSILILFSFLTFPLISQSNSSMIELDTIRKRNLKDMTNYYVVRKENKYGIVKEDGEYIIPIEYTNIKGESSDYAWVQQRSNNFLINLRSGETVLSGFSDITLYSNLMEVKKKGRVGLYSAKLGELVVPIKYDFIENARNCSVLKILHNGKYRSLYFSQGNKLIDQKFESLDFDYRGIIASRKGRKYLYVCQNGELVLNVKTNEFKLENDFFAYKENEKWKIQSLQKDATKASLEFENYLTRRYTHEGTFVKKDGKWGICDLKNQQMILPANYDSLSFAKMESSRLYYLKTYSFDGKVGLIDSKGKRLIEEEFDDVDLTINSVHKKITFWGKKGDYFSPIFNGALNPKFKYEKIMNIYIATKDIVIVKNKNKYGIYSTILGNEIIPCENDTIYGQFSNAHIFVKKNRYGVISADGEILIENYPQFKKIKTHFIKVFNDEGKVGVYDPKNKKFILNVEYDEIEWIVASYNPYMFRKGKYSGIVDFWEDKIVVPLESEYEEVIARHGADFIDGKLTTRVQKNDKWGWVDIKTGEVVIPIIYDEVLAFENAKTTEVKLKYNWIRIDKKGNKVN